MTFNANTDPTKFNSVTKWTGNCFAIKVRSINIIMNEFNGFSGRLTLCKSCNFFSKKLFVNTGWNAKIVVLKKTTLQLYFKTFIEKINSGNLIM